MHYLIITITLDIIRTTTLNIQHRNQQKGDGLWNSIPEKIKSHRFHYCCLYYKTFLPELTQYHG